jgi:hypothetical protein
MDRLEVHEVLAANVGIQRLWSGRCIIQPEEIVMESKIPGKRSVKDGNAHGVDIGLRKKSRFLIA